MSAIRNRTHCPFRASFFFTEIDPPPRFSCSFPVPMDINPFPNPAALCVFMVTPHNTTDSRFDYSPILIFRTTPNPPGSEFQAGPPSRFFCLSDPPISATLGHENKCREGRLSSQSRALDFREILPTKGRRRPLVPKRDSSLCIPGTSSPPKSPHGPLLSTQAYFSSWALARHPVVSLFPLYRTIDLHRQKEEPVWLLSFSGDGFLVMFKIPSQIVVDLGAFPSKRPFHIFESFCDKRFPEFGPATNLLHLFSGVPLF